LEDIARNGNSDFTTAKSDDVWIYPEESSSASGNMHDRAEAYLSRVLADSDAALLGHVTQQVSLFNSTKHNIVTDLLFQVDEVLRSDRTAEIQIGGKLVVTREGGIMHADGHRIEVRVNQFPPFETGGRYVLFLHRDARTGSYRVLSSDAFKVSGTTIHPAQTTAWATRVRVQIC